MSASEDQIARLRLIRSDNIGPVTYFHLLARFGSASAALDAVPDLATRGGGRAPRLASRASVEREIEQVARLGARYLFLGQGLYPPLLAEIETAPPALIVKGHVTLLEKPAIAMVGARNASAAACRFARMLAQDVGAAGTVIVSGLARGIDTAAHDGSLESGTIGVIAGGIDIFYPPENEERQRAIAERGLLVAEQPPGVEPRARHFPYRNRIIAALAQGTVVVEAAPRSGSLITARYATEFGRDVMAVPGSPLDPRAQGCNQLIREGAILVQNAEDVLETIRPFSLRPLAQPGLDYTAPSAAPDASEGERRTVSDLLSPTPVGVDEIIRQSGLAPAIVQTVLLELELAGRLERHAGGKVSLA
ncbi:MAG: Rossmann fold nucleotide-binding protein Smf possibly involved in DNA uptake [uncultured Sphingosinicella sp.]|uniref:Rossmann fold nucleotide-binding protein Smf possibly involved in DNA uptake n=1 Tax=uncultured Sphingosinicella sp. TaxID=478748 RepID=A0A6J4TI18_9SPHN|nr:DNA-processing protein DprA [uncultured Sphingosinicella sp.]CAA9523117.1 MAG: Rossmann fold nucleotide-binding protein Smf possibly involved in DNA uptake [uncultured Sphingosinicella sp.]